MAVAIAGGSPSPGAASNARSGSRRPADKPPRPQGERRNTLQDRWRRFEVELLPGLGPFVRTELAALPCGVEVEAEGSDRLQIRSDGWEALHGLRRAVAVYRLLNFEVPRPRALLGDEHLRRLLAAVDEVRRRAPAPFATFRLGAAGSDSAVFARLAAEFESATGLRHDPDEGGLLLRIRRGQGGSWQTLIRLTPRPLSARSWRRCNLPGGLNAAAGVAMLDLLQLRPVDRYLNPMVGSGTLLVEAPPVAEAVGYDLAPRALACARANLAAAGRKGVTLELGDATALPLEGGRFDAVAADLPWGDAVGSHRSNAELYPAFLTEMARLCAPGARMVLLTHELALFAGVVEGQGAWRVRRRLQIYHGGHHPEMVLLVRQRSRR